LGKEEPGREKENVMVIPRRGSDGKENTQEESFIGLYGDWDIRAQEGYRRVTRRFTCL
jgi:hypothetical protein